MSSVSCILFVGALWGEILCRGIGGRIFRNRCLLLLEPASWWATGSNMALIDEEVVFLLLAYLP